MGARAGRVRRSAGLAVGGSSARAKTFRLRDPRPKFTGLRLALAQPRERPSEPVCRPANDHVRFAMAKEKHTLGRLDFAAGHAASESPKGRWPSIIEGISTPPRCTIAPRAMNQASCAASRLASPPAQISRAGCWIARANENVKGPRRGRARRAEPGVHLVQARGGELAALSPRKERRFPGVLGGNHAAVRRPNRRVGDLIPLSAALDSSTRARTMLAFRYHCPRVRRFERRVASKTHRKTLLGRLPGIAPMYDRHPSALLAR